MNKVYISTLLSKRLDRKYKNGLNSEATLIYLKVIKTDEIIGLHFRENGSEKFKAHLTENISNRDQLHLQGYKVIYKDFSNLKFEIFSMDLFSQLKKLIYKSFKATGKALGNSNYDSEWKTIKPKKDLELPFNS